VHVREQFLSQSSSPLKAHPIGKDNQSTYRSAGIREPDAQTLAAGFARDPEARDILLAWARARASGQVAGDVAEKVEVQANATALYVLRKYKTAAKLDGTKETVGEWGLKET
jgi:hypothetical protein